VIRRAERPSNGEVEVGRTTRRRARAEEDAAAAVCDLIDDIRTLRLTLTADLAAAAGAVEADEPAVVADILAASRVNVMRLSEPKEIVAVVGISPTRLIEHKAMSRPRQLANCATRAGLDGVVTECTQFRCHSCQQNSPPSSS
jgi:hypothetical protein